MSTYVLVLLYMSYIDCKIDDCYTVAIVYFRNGREVGKHIVPRRRGSYIIRRGISCTGLLPTIEDFNCEIVQ